MPAGGVQGSPSRRGGPPETNIADVQLATLCKKTAPVVLRAEAAYWLQRALQIGPKQADDTSYLVDLAAAAGEEPALDSGAALALAARIRDELFGLWTGGDDAGGLLGPLMYQLYVQSWRRLLGPGPGAPEWSSQPRALALFKAGPAGDIAPLHQLMSSKKSREHGLGAAAALVQAFLRPHLQPAMRDFIAHYRKALGHVSSPQQVVSAARVVQALLDSGAVMASALVRDASLRELITSRVIQVVMLHPHPSPEMHVALAEAVGALVPVLDSSAFGTLVPEMLPHLMLGLFPHGKAAGPVEHDVRDVWASRISHILLHGVVNLHQVGSPVPEGTAPASDSAAAPTAPAEATKKKKLPLLSISSACNMLMDALSHKAVRVDIQQTGKGTQHIHVLRIGLVQTFLHFLRGLPPGHLEGNLRMVVDTIFRLFPSGGQRGGAHLDRCVSHLLRHGVGSALGDRGQLALHHLLLESLPSLSTRLRLVVLQELIPLACSIGESAWPSYVPLLLESSRFSSSSSPISDASLPPLLTSPDVATRLLAATALRTVVAPLHGGQLGLVLSECLRHCEAQMALATEASGHALHGYGLAAAALLSSVPTSLSGVPGTQIQQALRLARMLAKQKAEATHLDVGTALLAGLIAVHHSDAAVPATALSSLLWHRYAPLLALVVRQQDQQEQPVALALALGLCTVLETTGRLWPQVFAPATAAAAGGRQRPPSPPGFIEPGRVAPLVDLLARVAVTAGGTPGSVQARLRAAFFDLVAGPGGFHWLPVVAEGLVPVALSYWCKEAAAASLPSNPVSQLLGALLPEGASCGGLLELGHAGEAELNGRLQGQAASVAWAVLQEPSLLYVPPVVAAAAGSGYPRAALPPVTLAMFPGEETPFMRRACAPAVPWPLFELYAAIGVVAGCLRSLRDAAPALASLASTLAATPQGGAARVNFLQCTLAMWLLALRRWGPSSKEQLPPSWRTALPPMLQAGLACGDSQCAVLAAHALGLMLALSPDSLTRQMVRDLSSPAARRNTRALPAYSYALGCLLHHVGGLRGQAHLSAVVHALLAACRASDATPMTHVWALHGLRLAVDAVGNSVAPSASSVASLLEELLYCGYFSDPPPALWVAVGSVAQTLMLALGPDVASARRGSIRAIMLRLQHLQRRHASAPVRRGATLVMLGFIIVTPAHVVAANVMPSLVAQLQEVDSPLRLAAATSLRQLLEWAEPRSSAAAGGMGDLPEVLLGRLDLEHDPDTVSELRLSLLRLVEREGVAEPVVWVKLLRNVVLGKGKLSSPQGAAAAAAVVPEEEEEEEEDEAAVSVLEAPRGAAALAVDAGGRRGSEGPRHRTRVFACHLLSVLLKLLLQSPDGAQRGQAALIPVLGMIVDIMFAASTSSTAELRLQGLVCLGLVITSFAKHRDPDFPELPLLQQYDAQLVSALRPALQAGQSPVVGRHALSVYVSYLQAAYAGTSQRGEAECRGAVELLLIPCRDALLKLWDGDGADEFGLRGGGAAATDGGVFSDASLVDFALATLEGLATLWSVLGGALTNQAVPLMAVLLGSFCRDSAAVAELGAPTVDWTWRRSLLLAGTQWVARFEKALPLVLSHSGVIFSTLQPFAQTQQAPSSLATEISEAFQLMFSIVIRRLHHHLCSPTPTALPDEVDASLAADLQVAHSLMLASAASFPDAVPATVILQFALLLDEVVQRPRSQAALLPTRPDQSRLTTLQSDPTIAPALAALQCVAVCLRLMPPGHPLLSGSPSPDDGAGPTPLLHAHLRTLAFALSGSDRPAALVDAAAQGVAAVAAKMRDGAMSDVTADVLPAVVQLSIRAAQAAWQSGAPEPVDRPAYRLALAALKVCTSIDSQAGRAGCAALIAWAAPRRAPTLVAVTLPDETALATLEQWLSGPQEAVTEAIQVLRHAAPASVRRLVPLMLRILLRGVEEPCPLVDLLIPLCAVAPGEASSAAVLPLLLSVLTAHAAESSYQRALLRAATGVPTFKGHLLQSSAQLQQVTRDMVQAGLEAERRLLQQAHQKETLLQQGQQKRGGASPPRRSQTRAKPTLALSMNFFGGASS